MFYVRYIQMVKEIRKISDNASSLPIIDARCPENSPRKIQFPKQLYAMLMVLGKLHSAHQADEVCITRKEGRV